MNFKVSSKIQNKDLDILFPGPDPIVNALLSARSTRPSSRRGEPVDDENDAARDAEQTTFCLKLFLF